MHALDLTRVVIVVALLSAAKPLRAAVIPAQPSNYRVLVRSLKPGDTLALAAGAYSALSISNLNGTESSWITITGPTSGAAATILCGEGGNTVEIVNSSYVSLENLKIDSRGIPGCFGISAKGHEENRIHHIRIEGNVLVGQDAGQGTVGISTKTPTWGWTIRNNQIVGAGTGMYLGESDGSQPFVAGLIENNLVKDTIGYNLQIKHQTSLPAISGMPLEPTTTIIRNNVFSKQRWLNPEFDRPNVLLGGFPLTGPGSLNMYEVYGNFFFYNHREALFQASGRVSLHDNIFVDGPYTYPAIVLRDHDHALKVAYIYNNTVYTSGPGIYFGSSARVDDAVVGNAVFALKPISGSIRRQVDNILDFFEHAARYFTKPSFKLDEMDLYPLAGKCQGPAIDLSDFHTNVDYTLDFNGTPKTQAKGTVTFRGAYAGEGSNPGWRVQAGIKVPNPPRPNAEAIIVAVDPSTIPVGRTTKITVTGANLTPDATLAVAGKGISISETKVITDTELLAIVAAHASAVPGIRELRVKTSSGISNMTPLRVTVMKR
jgi:hypothetical protein